MKRILFTGGAGAGKTSTIEYVKNYYESKGFDVFIINEVPTMLLNNGFNSKKCGKLEFLELITKIELYLRDVLEKETEKSLNKNKIMLIDKCPVDNMAFIKREELDKMLEKLNTSYYEIINSFDLIIHLETIAKDYPELYTNENNKNRTLDKELAVSRNNRLLEAYKESNKRVIIKVYKDIKDKQERVIDEIEKVLKEG
ncbi:MAG: AAA family ATPase [Clostridia bacterium]|nr:AAA family ATPase [Clostridia bacterium]